MTVGPGVFIGIQEAYKNQPFSYGSLLVDVDNTILCYINKFSFMRQVDERELKRLMGSKEDSAKFPEVEDIIVKHCGSLELSQFRSKLLLDAIGKNQEPSETRHFDAKVERESPTKNLNKWCEQFNAVLKPRSSSVLKINRHKIAT